MYEKALMILIFENFVWALGMVMVFHGKAVQEEGKKVYVESWENAWKLFVNNAEIWNLFWYHWQMTLFINNHS